MCMKYDMQSHGDCSLIWRNHHGNRMSFIYLFFFFSALIYVVLRVMFCYRARTRSLVNDLCTRAAYTEHNSSQSVLTRSVEGTHTFHWACMVNCMKTHPFKIIEYTKTRRNKKDSRNSSTKCELLDTIRHSHSLSTQTHSHLHTHLIGEWCAMALTISKSEAIKKKKWRMLAITTLET